LGIDNGQTSVLRSQLRIGGCVRMQECFGLGSHFNQIKLFIGSYSGISTLHSTAKACCVREIKVYFSAVGNEL